MEDFSSSRFEGIGNTFRKRRSHTSRRPRPESQPTSEGRDISCLSSTPPSDDTRTGSSDENSGGGHISRRKELSLSQCASKFPASSGPEGEKPARKSKKVDVGLDELYGNNGGDQGRMGTNHRRGSEGVLAPANWKNTSRVKDGSEPQKTMTLSSIKSDESSCPSVDASGNESKLKKLKVKVGGVTRTIDANVSGKSSRGSDAAQKSVHKNTSDDDNSPLTDRRHGLQGIPWKDFSRGGFSLGREESSVGKGNAKSHSGKQGDKSDSVRKSKRLPKKRAIDTFDDDDVDDEIRYLEKLKNARLAAGIRDDDEESSRKHRRLSKFSGNSPENLEGSLSSRSSKDGKKRSPSEDTDYEDEEELLSDGEQESRKRKKGRKDPVDSLVEPKREMTLTTRQRALQSGRDTAGLCGNGVEFPNGLPPAPPKKQKEKLSEVEQQLKKAEAAHRRRMQNEKAARESEAEAIRKILGQDSSRKKREEKKKKRDEELAQEKAADELVRASTSVRLVMGPNGTTVTFPNDMGLPSIFESKPCSYPPPREKCAGPSCTNPYKYRDSKTKLPLCSLHCYKAIQGNTHGEAAAC